MLLPAPQWFDSEPSGHTSSAFYWLIWNHSSHGARMINTSAFSTLSACCVFRFKAPPWFIHVIIRELMAAPLFPFCRLVFSVVFQHRIIETWASAQHMWFYIVLPRDFPLLRWDKLFLIATCLDLHPAAVLTQLVQILVVPKLVKSVYN